MSIQFKVNGKKCSVDTRIRRETSLNAYIRYHLGLTGTKAMCHEGGCGACIVKVHGYRYPSRIKETFSVNSCLVLVFSCHGWEITTIEGLGNRKDGYHELQKKVVACNATQCGYCTPGWVMHLSSLLDKNLTMVEMERSFASNTCRCTGFRPIMDTVKSCAVDASPELLERVKDMEDVWLCNKSKKCMQACERRCSTKSDGSDWSFLQECEDDENISENIKSTPIELNFGKTRFYKVYLEEDIFDILNKEGENSYMLVDGNTGKGVYETFDYPRILIDISSVASLKSYEFDQNLIIGANMSLEDCIKLFKDTAKSNSDFSYLAEIATHFDLIANMPVRKLGSIAGNLMLKHEMPSYQSDVFLTLEAVGATVSVRTWNGRTNSLTLLEFLKYDMVGKLLVNIELPPLNNSYIFKSYKIMPRNQNALAIVNAAFLVKLGTGQKTVDNIKIVFGDISADFVHARNTENYLLKKNIFRNDILQRAMQILKQELVVVENPPNPSIECRKKLALGLFYKFALSISPSNTPSARNRSGCSLIKRPLSKGTQKFQTDSSLYPLNEPVTKLEGLIQSAGEAQYANDTPAMVGQVFGAFVLSTVHSGEICEIDASEVLKINGVLDILTAKDIPGKNSFILPGIQLQTLDEEILASGCIKFYGQPVAILVADSEDLAAKSAKKVKVTYKNTTTTPVLTIDQAKKDSKRYAVGDATIEPTTKGNNTTKVITGTYEIGAQYHYYLEPMTCVVIPVDNILEVYDSSQWIDLTQISIAQCLGIRESDVVVKVRRIGGGFGGKISRNAQVATACALVAKRLNVPCRFILPMQTNMAMAGRRLPCQCEYEVGVDDDGKIQHLSATIVEDDGCSHNENILAYTLGGFKNCYKTENFTLKTATVVTDLASNTFARAPGTGEGITCIEHIMEHIAFAVNKDPTAVRLVNMRTDDNDLPTLIEELKKEIDYDQRVKEIKEFNQCNRWRKKAISINVMSFPIEFYGNYSALVSIYRGDGTVTVTSGGIEMGQGLNTKAAQVCAYELGIPLHYITVISSYSFACANNVFSGSSITTESVCYSIIKACGMLNLRLEPIKSKLTKPTWKEIIQKAGEEEIDLTAIYMMTEKEEDLKGYSSFGVAVSECEMDILTGRFEPMRVDILEDVGLSPNPLLDVGQLEGGYVQGMGYFTTEKMGYCKKTGKTLTNRSLTYHVPLALDIPADFRVKFRYNSKNPRGVLGAKSVGEMGIGTAHGVTHCLRKCIYESRKDSGYDPTEWITIDTPYDTESILKALDVKLEEFVFS